MILAWNGPKRTNSRVLTHTYTRSGLKRTCDRDGDPTPLDLTTLTLVYEYVPFPTLAEKETLMPVYNEVPDLEALERGLAELEKTDPAAVQLVIEKLMGDVVGLVTRIRMGSAIAAPRGLAAPDVVLNTSGQGDGESEGTRTLIPGTWPELCQGGSA